MMSGLPFSFFRRVCPPLLFLVFLLAVPQISQAIPPSPYGGPVLAGPFRDPVRRCFETRFDELLDSDETFLKFYCNPPNGPLLGYCLADKKARFRNDFLDPSSGAFVRARRAECIDQSSTFETLADFIVDHFNAEHPFIGDETDYVLSHLTNAFDHALECGDNPGCTSPTLTPVTPTITGTTFSDSGPFSPEPSSGTLTNPLPANPSAGAPSTPFPGPGAPEGNAGSTGGCSLETGVVGSNSFWGIGLIMFSMWGLRIRKK